MDLPDAAPSPSPTAPVTCLGKEFPDDDARRAYYTAILRGYLDDPEFRRTPGFPAGTTEDILRMSDPPYYTSCPNPFLPDFVRTHGTPYDEAAEAEAPYHREPLAMDTSVGKTDALYKAHGYHTKVPHLAIVPYILHYTRPGDLVLDGFAGSGMTGVAAQWCGAATEAYRAQVEKDRREMGLPAPEWGARRAILNDLGPAATFIAAGFNLPFDVAAFAREARRILDEVDAEIGWMYETTHTDGVTKGRINFTVWSEVYACPQCGHHVVFADAALDPETHRVRDQLTCPGCTATYAKKEQMTLVMETFADPATGQAEERPLRAPWRINYTAGKSAFEKAPDEADLAVIAKIASLPRPSAVPTTPFPDSQMRRVGRMATTKSMAVHRLYLPRPAHALAGLWSRASHTIDPDMRRMLLWFVEQSIWTMSILNRFRPTGFSQVQQYLSGVYYVPSQMSELSTSYVLEGKLDRLVRKAFVSTYSHAGSVAVTTGDCSTLGIADDTIDYIFTDPPFGENIYYADLNFLVESWHRVTTEPSPEAIVDRVRQKDVVDYQSLMKSCVAEYFRVLKPGRWMTVVFSNSSAAIWRALQEAIGSAGFVVADVRTLNKKQRAFQQVVNDSVDTDLVVSAYKPLHEGGTAESPNQGGPASAWAFVEQHLRNVPVFVGRRREVKDDAGNVTGIVEESDVQVERTEGRLFDRMVASHVQRRISVPLGSADFRAGLAVRYVSRDGMWFLPAQVPEYDRKRKPEAVVQLLGYSVSDEASAIRWVRQQLATKPQKYQDIHPLFTKEMQMWARHERPIDLRAVLDENFLRYDGTGDVPSQVHAYLSTNYHTMRNLPKDAPELVAMARDRWYVPDPSKQADLDKVRTRALIREFETYLGMTKAQLKAVRTEAVRAGFADAWANGNYAAIVDLGDKLPAVIVQEDETAGMYYDNAVTLVRG